MCGLSRLSPLQLIALAVVGALLLGGPLLQLQNNPVGFVALLIGLVVGITIHEFSHASVAVALGDPTPRLQGRVSLNPLRHLDPLGSLFMLVAGFGWGRPVMFNPFNLRSNQRLGSALVSVAGPLSNIALALALAFILYGPLRPTGVAFQLLQALFAINVGLAAFNLIPIPPLDGFGLLENLLPESMAAAIRPLVPYGALILLALVFLVPGGLQMIVGPIREAILTFILAIVRLGR